MSPKYFLLLLVSLVSFGPWMLFAQSAGDFRTHQTGYWSDVNTWERFDGTIWITPAPSVPDSTAGQIAIRVSHTVTDTLSIGVDQVTVQPGATVVVSGTPVVFTIGTGGMTVNGTLKATGTPNPAAPWTINPIGALTIAGGGTYEHNQSGGGLPTAVWSTGSTCLVTGPIGVSSIPAGGNQNFYNLTWNCQGQTANCSIGAYTSTISGSVTVVSTGSGRFYFMAGSSGTMSVLGDFLVQGGNWAMNGTSAQTFDTVMCYGNLIVTGGTFSISRGTQSSGTGTSVFKLYGDFSVTGAALQNSNGANGKLVFTRQGTQSLSLSNVTYGTGTGTPFNIEVANGSTLNLGTNNLGASPNSSTGSFRVTSGAAIVSAHPNGINGNVTCTGASGGGNSFATDAGYSFNGSVAQITGSFVPSSVGTLTINNASGVTLTGTTTVNGTLSLADGNLNTGANIMIVGPAGTVSRTNGQVVGSFQKRIPSGTNVTTTFEIGSGTSYAPMNLTFASVATPGDVVATTIGSEHPNIGTSGIDSTRDVNRYWSLTNIGTGVTTYDAVLNFPPTDVDAGANPNNFIGTQYSGGIWSGLTEGIRTATSLQVLGTASFGDFAIGQPIPSTVVSNGTGGGSWTSSSTWQGGAVPSGVDSVVILSSDSVFVSASTSCAGLLVQVGGRLSLSAKLSPTNVRLDGVVYVYADTLAPSGVTTVGGVGIYNHAVNGGRIPAATWSVGSTCLISGAVANAPGNGNQNFYNVTWNCPGQTANLNMGWNNITIGGNITVLNTGSARWQMTAPSASGSATVTIMGDVNQSNGTFTTNGTSNAGTTIIVNHHGNINITGGNFAISRGTQGGTGTSTWNLIDGNLSIMNATTQNSTATPGGARFVFGKQGTQTLSLTNVTFAGGGLPMEVAMGTMLNAGSSVVRGNGIFVLDSAATLACGHSGGLDSLLQNTGAKTLHPSANYLFDGAAQQITGNLLPGTINSLTINNPTGVTLSANTTINGVLLVMSGDLDLNGSLITLGPSGLLSETAGNTVKGNSGQITTTRILNGPSASQDIAGLGLMIGSSADLGSTVITRGHALQTGAASDSIRRYFDVSPTNNAGLNAALVFRYDDSELTGSESQLGLYKSIDGGTTWTPQGGVLNTTANTITLSGVNSLSRWTAARYTPPVGDGDFRTHQSGNWNDVNTWERYNGAVWIYPAPYTPTFADSAISIRTGDSVAVTADTTVDQVTIGVGATVAVNALVTLRITNGADASDMTVNGVLSSAGTVAASGVLSIRNTGTFRWLGGGSLPTASWADGSTIEILGVAGSAPSNGNQNFSNVTWNCPTQTANVNMGWNNITIGGSITIVSTGTGRWQMCAPQVDSTATVTILGDVNQSGGNFTTNGTGNGNTTIRIQHHGNINVTGGNFSISRGSQGGTGTAMWNLYDGNFTMSNATAQNSNAAGARFVFTKAGAQSLSLTSVTFAGGGLPVVVDSGTTLSTGTSVLRGSGAFVLNATATLACGHPGGLDSLLQTTGSRTLSPGANYTFNASTAQSTGSILPPSMNDLTINNAAGVTLGDSITVNGALSLMSGDLNLNGNVVQLGPSGILSETPGNVVTGLSGIIGAIRALNAPSDTVNIGGLGVRIGSVADLGTTVLARGHAPQTITGTAIRRYFDIIPANNTGLNATLHFHYDDSELNGAIESGLRLFKSTDNGATWTQAGGAVDTVANMITLGGVNSFSRWTAAVPSLPPLPSQVVLVSPPHGAIIDADSARCVWQQSAPSVTNYWFERATDSLFAVNRFVDSTLTDTSRVTRQLLTNTAYWWRVRAKNLAGWGPFSNGRKFIAIFTGVNDIMAAPLEFSLKQNYPNPFNPATTIRFSVEKSGRATLEIFNLLGQKVMTLFDGNADAGKYHNVQFDGRSLPSGMYFYRLNSGDKSELRKLVLLK